MASLLALARAEQEIAKSRLRRRVYLYGLTLLGGVASLWLTGMALYVTALVTLGVTAGAWWLRWAGYEAHGLAESARRRAAVAKELGTDPDSLGTAELQAEFGAKTREIAPQWEDPEYFATGAMDRGPERLCSALQESAFWSARLYRAAGRRTAVRLLIVIAVLLSSIGVVIFFQSTSVSTAAVRIGILALTTLIGIDQLGTALAFFGAARSSQRASVQFEKIDPFDTSQLLTAYADYSIATASAPPIPTAIYMKNHDAIEEAWRNRAV